MKRLSLLLILAVCLLTLTACDKLKISEAQTAFKAAEYQKVVEILENIEYDDPAVAEMHDIAKSFVAYDNQDYQTVVDLLSGIDDPNGYYRELLKLSKANLFFVDEKYLDVVTTLADLETKGYYDLYSWSIDALIAEAIAQSNTQAIADLLKADPAVSDTVYDTITEQCYEYSYASFLFMDALIAELPESVFRSKLENYAQNSGKIRAKAFLQGEWKLVYNDDDTAIVNVHVEEDDAKCFGILTQTSEYMKQFYYEEEDLYWCDFIFEGDVPISASHIVRSYDGSSYYTLCSFKIDYENDQITVHVSGTTFSDRIWTRNS